MKSLENVHSVKKIGVSSLVITESCKSNCICVQNLLETQNANNCVFVRQVLLFKVENKFTEAQNYGRYEVGHDDCIFIVSNILCVFAVRGCRINVYIKY